MKIGNDLPFVVDVCYGDRANATNDFPSEHLLLITPDKDEYLSIGL